MATINTWQDQDFSVCCHHGVKCAHSRVRSMSESGEMTWEVQTAASTPHTAVVADGLP
jgi:hypothetical protein